MQTHIIASLLLLLAVLAAGLIMAVYFPVAIIWATYEDLYGEWTQCYLFAVAGLTAAWLAIRYARYRVFFSLLALACLYVVGEEISWGQRLFEFESPDFFKRHNLQREANLHNLLVGPYSTVLKDVVEYTLAAMLLLYGAIYPLLLRLRRRSAVWLDERLRVPAPPLYLWPFFAAAALLEIGLFHFNEAEFAEILVGCALAIMTLHYAFARRRDLPVHAPPSWEGSQSTRFSVVIVAMVAVVVMLAWGTTTAFLDSPAKRARIENRVLNGYEKYAGRYERRGHWETAAELYLRVHDKEPHRTSILRRIASNYQKLGNDELFWKYNGKALSIGLGKYRKNPDKISANLSLARTYEQRGDQAKAREHGQKAHRIATERAEKNPDSAHWAYWLGKTARQIKDHDLALAQYRKAFELKPGSSKYRKAYYSMRRRAGE